MFFSIHLHCHLIGFYYVFQMDWPLKLIAQKKQESQLKHI